MTRPFRVRVIAAGLAALLSLALAGRVLAADADVPGSTDHPFFNRVPFAYIVSYEQKEAGEYRLFLGPLPSDDASAADIKQAETLKGKVTRIQYSVISQQSASEVFYQYDVRIKRSKFDNLAETKGAATRAPGGSKWLAAVYAPLGKDAADALAISSAPSQRRFYAGRLAGPEGDIYVVAVWNQHTPREVRVQLDIIETK
jgi:hypothetical protein